MSYSICRGSLMMWEIEEHLEYSSTVGITIYYWKKNFRVPQNEWYNSNEKIYNKVKLQQIQQETL